MCVYVGNGYVDGLRGGGSGGDGFDGEGGGEEFCSVVFFSGQLEDSGLVLWEGSC